MFLFILKLISTVRKAIAGRRYPSQLAWGLALGVLLGLIPHGNLLTIALVLVVLTLQVNHAMVALVGIGLTFVAPRLDPQFHAVGQWFFEQPQAAETMAKAWQMPLVPWTDLNNTVVMGSFLIGLAAVLPIVILTYPVFRRWSLALENALALDVDSQDDRSDGQVTAAETTVIETTRVDEPHSSLKSAERTGEFVATNDQSAASNSSTKSQVTMQHESTPNELPPMTKSGRVYDVRRIDSADAATPPAPASAARKTRVAIAVVPERSKSENSEPPQANLTQNKVAAVNSSVDDQQKIDEALSYLLRQLRDSKDKDAA